MRYRLFNQEMAALTTGMATSRCKAVGFETMTASGLWSRASSSDRSLTVASSSSGSVLLPGPRTTRYHHLTLTRYGDAGTPMDQPAIQVHLNSLRPANVNILPSATRCHPYRSLHARRISPCLPVTVGVCQVVVERFAQLIPVVNDPALPREAGSDHGWASLRSSKAAGVFAGAASCGCTPNLALRRYKH